MNQLLDIDGCRKVRPYSRNEYIGRILWAAVFPLFRLSPRSFFGWRRFILRVFGATVGRDAHVYASTRIYLPWNLKLGDYSSIGEWALIYNLGLVDVGVGATVSQRAHICAGSHDYSMPTLPLMRLPIVIGPYAWVCADAFIGPGRRVGEGAIVAAGSVVVKDVPPWCIVGGNPARAIKRRCMRGSTG